MEFTEMKAVRTDNGWAVNLRVGGHSFLGEQRFSTEAEARAECWRVNEAAGIGAMVHGDPDVEADLARDPEWPPITPAQREAQRTPHVWDWRSYGSP